MQTRSSSQFFLRDTQMIPTEPDGGAKLFFYIKCSHSLADFTRLPETEQQTLSDFCIF